jgi:hypothetical protein
VTVRPELIYGRDVLSTSFGTNWGPTGVSGGNGDVAALLNPVTLRAVRHWASLFFIVRGNTAGLVLQFMLYDQTGGSPGTQLGLVGWHAPPVASIAQPVMGQLPFVPVAGVRNLALRWASNGGSWEVLHGSFMNGTLRIAEAVSDRALSSTVGQP